MTSKPEIQTTATSPLASEIEAAVRRASTGDEGDVTHSMFFAPTHAGKTTVLDAFALIERWKKGRNR